MEKVKIIKLPASKMIKTPEFDMEGESFFKMMRKFWKNVVDRHQDIFPRDFMPITDAPKNFWLFSIMGIDTGKFNMEGFEIIDFEGGYYATATASDPDDGTNEDFIKTIQEVKEWVNQSGSFELDFTETRLGLSHRTVGDDEELQKALGYVQVAIFIPIKIKKK